jgi:uncharacterized protein
MQGKSMRTPLTDNKIFLFLIFVVALMAIPYIQIINSGSMQGPVVLLLMWSPGIAAFVTQLITARTLKGLGWRLGNWRYLLTSFLLPLGAAILVYGLSWIVGIVPFAGAQLVDAVEEATGRRLMLPLAILATVVVLFVPSLAAALGEEIGWRGLLLPELAKRFQFTFAVLWSAVIWAIYHYPAILFADYHSDAPRWFALIMFTISIFSFSVIAGWLRLKSGSLWPAAILHASHNLFVQAVFDKMTLKFGLAPYLTTEFGAGLAIVYALVAIYYWRRRGELEEQLLLQGA